MGNTNSEARTRRDVLRIINDTATMDDDAASPMRADNTASPDEKHIGECNDLIRTSGVYIRRLNPDSSTNVQMLAMIQEGIRSCVQAAAADKDAFLRSLNAYIDECNFRNSRNYTSIPRSIDDRHNFVGYKLVVLRDLDKKCIDDTCFALLELGVWSVRDSVHGRCLASSQLTNGEKYCTDSAVPLRAWIIGAHELLKDRVEQCRRGRIQFVSNYDAEFVYAFDQKITEPNFGKPGKGCLQGIHFFIDRKSAFRYIKTGFISVDRSRLTISGNVSSEDVAEIFEESTKVAIEKNINDRIRDAIADLRQYQPSAVPSKTLDSILDVMNGAPINAVDEFVIRDAIAQLHRNINENAIQTTITQMFSAYDRRQEALNTYAAAV